MPASLKRFGALEAEMDTAAKKAGFKGLSAFLRERARLTGGRSEPIEQAKVPAAANPKPARVRKARVDITPERRQSIIDALKTGKQSTAAIAKEFGVSTSSVSIIKKDEGLTRARK